MRRSCCSRTDPEVRQTLTSTGVITKKIGVVPVPGALGLGSFPASIRLPISPWIDASVTQVVMPVASWQPL